VLSDTAVTALFAALARARGNVRALHPIGRAYEARLRLSADAPPPLRPGTTQTAVARLSRATGLRPPLPDVHGLAVRFDDQDLLFSATWQRHLLRPSRSIWRGELSTILPYEHAGRRFVLGALPDGPGRFLLVDAPPLGRWGAPWGELALGAALHPADSAALRFHPWHTAPDLTPVGFVNALRRPSYAASQQQRTEPRSTSTR
jgi:hypothetical protein